VKYYRVIKNGRTLRKPRTMRQIQHLAWDGHDITVVDVNNGTRFELVEVLSFGRLLFSRGDGSRLIYDGLDGSLRQVA